MAGENRGVNSSVSRDSVRDTISLLNSQFPQLSIGGSSPFTSSSGSSRSTIGSFRFLVPNYGHYSFIISENGRLVERVLTDFIVIYFDRELAVGHKLILRVESCNPSAGEFGFVFGLTTCNTQSIQENECHAVSMCEPNHSCGGQCISLRIRNGDSGEIHTFEMTGNGLSVKRVNNDGKRFTGKQRADGKDQLMFADRKAFPFIILNGNVHSLRISDSSSPIPVPTVANAAPSSSSSSSSSSSASPASEPPARMRPIPTPVVRQAVGSDTSSIARRSPDQPAPRITASTSDDPRNGFRLRSSIPVTRNTGHQSAMWLENDSVSFTNFVMTCTAARGSPSYIFHNMVMPEQTKITFRVLDLETDPGQICFGVTNNRPDRVQVSGLPADPLQLQPPGGWVTQNWYVRSFTVKKKETIVIVKSGRMFQAKAAIGSGFMFEIQGQDKMFPFFCFNGAVKSIFLNNSKPKPNPIPVPRVSHPASSSSSRDDECIVCMDRKRVIACMPCGHMAYCQACKAGAERRRGALCPICRSAVTEFKRIFL